MLSTSSLKQPCSWRQHFLCSWSCFQRQNTFSIQGNGCHLWNLTCSLPSSSHCSCIIPVLYSKYVSFYGDVILTDFFLFQFWWGHLQMPYDDPFFHQLHRDWYANKGWDSTQPVKLSLGFAAQVQTSFNFQFTPNILLLF